MQELLTRHNIFFPMTEHLVPGRRQWDGAVAVPNRIGSDCFGGVDRVSRRNDLV
jgi:hypothetical protein